MSVIAPEGRILVREALPALGQLAAFLFIVGCVYVIDYFVRAMFGTVEGAVGWIPFAGRVVKRNVHVIEQKVTNRLGTAEQAFDRRIGTSFNKLAHIIRQIPRDLLNQAELLLGVTALLGLFLTRRVAVPLIRSVTLPIRTRVTALDHLLHRLRSGVKSIDHWIRHSVWPKLAALAALVAGIATHDLPYLRRRERALGRDLSRLWKWTKAHRYIIPAGVFLGSFVWALGKLGLAWVRCSNVKKVGRAICRTPSPIIDALIAALLAELVLANLRTLAHFAEAVEHDAARGVAELVGVATRADGQFTIA